MRVGFDLTCLKAPMGGYERYAQSLLAALARQSDPPHMVVYTERAYARRLVPPDMETRAVATLPRFLLKVFLQDQTYWPWLLQRARLDVVHTPIFAGMLGAPRPWVLTVHDLIPLHTPAAVSRSAAAYWRIILPRTVRRADAIITGSEYIRREILTSFDLSPERVITIPHGVDARFTPTDDAVVRERVRRRYALPARFLLFVGIASPRKNIDRLVREFGALPESDRRDTHLVIAGPPGWKNAALARALAASPIRSRIRHIGVVADEDLPGLYGLAAGVVNLSSHEGFGLPPLEAMACGVPLVCSDRTSFPEIVGDAALLVDPDDGAAIRRALATLIAGGPDVEARRAEGLVRARRYTWESAAAATLGVYRRVAG
jgi:alpha-1,3-rhamnosyl/mannosyltransferase